MTSEPSAPVAAALPLAVSAHPVRELFTLAIPLTANSMSVAVMLFIDALMVSGLGTSAIAAVLPVQIMLWLIWAIPTGVTNAAGIFSAQAIGKQDHDEAVRYTWQGIWIGLLIVLVAILAQLNAGPLLLLLTPSLPGTPPSDSLFDWSHADRHVNQLMHSYFNWRNWALPFIAIQGPIFAYFSALRRPWLPVRIALYAYVLNIEGNYILIYGKLGLPALGVSGAAISSVLASAVQAGILLWYFIGAARAGYVGSARQPVSGRLERRPHLTLARPNLFRFRRLLDIGIPAGCNGLLDIVGWMLIMTIFVKKFGTEALAATNIVTEYMRLSFMPSFGVAGAAATIIGTLVGAGQPRLAISRARLALAFVMGYMGVCGILMILLRYPLIALFNRDRDPQVVAAVAAAGTWMMVMAGLFQVFDACNVVYSSGCRAVGDTKFVVWLMAGSSLFSVALGYYLTRYQPQLGSFGPWLAGWIYVIILGLAFAWRFESRKWEGIDIFNQPAVRESSLPVQPAGDSELPVEGKIC